MTIADRAERAPRRLLGHELQDLAAAFAPPHGVCAVVHERGVELFRDGRPVDGDVPTQLLAAADETLAAGELLADVEVLGDLTTLRLTRVRLAGTTLVVAVGVADTSRAVRPRPAAEPTDPLDRMRELVATGADHAQRTPLTVIMGFARTLRQHWRELTAEDVDGLLDGLDRHAHRLDTILARRQLLGLRSEDVVRRTVDVDELVTAALRAATMPGDERVVAAPCRLRATLGPELFQLMLVELLDNGLQRGGADHVEVVTSDRDGTLEVAVADDGRGLEDVDTAVLPFVGQADGSTGGLGLALAQRVARLHGGDLEIHPREDGGTRVVARFPDSVAA